MRYRVKKLLLLLDNFEHVLPAAASVAERLIACPALKVLATSRAALRIDGEQEVPLAPMNTPEQPWPDLEELMRYEAVQLFIERARQVAPDFRVTPEICACVAEICARVDGLPLAIELAAARVKLLPPQALLSRLVQRLSLLVGGARDRPPRQQTLRATIDWSYHLLNAEQQAVFRKLGAFAGGCTLAAAEAVCSAADVLGNLGELVDQSLLCQDTGADGERRYAQQTSYALRRSDAEPVYRALHIELGASERGGGIDEWIVRLAAARKETYAACSAPDAALTRTTRWAGYDVDVRFRLHRFAAHIVEHTIQSENCWLCVCLASARQHVSSAESGGPAPPTSDAPCRSCSTCLTQRTPRARHHWWNSERLSHGKCVDRASRALARRRRVASSAPRWLVDGCPAASGGAFPAVDHGSVASPVADQSVHLPG